MDTAELRKLSEELRLEAKRSRLVLPFAALIGIFFLATGLKISLGDLEAKLTGSLGLVGGVLIGALATRWFSSTMPQSYASMLGAPSEKVAQRYLQELDDINLRTLQQWQRGGKFLTLLVGLLLVIGRWYLPTRALIDCVFLTAGGVTLLGIVVLRYQKTRPEPDER